MYKCVCVCLHNETVSECVTVSPGDYISHVAVVIVCSVMLTYLSLLSTRCTQAFCVSNTSCRYCSTEVVMIYSNITTFGVAMN